MLVRTTYLNEIKNYHDKEIGETYLAPDAANMSAHSLGSEVRNSVKSQNEIEAWFTNHKVQHEIEQQNLHMSNHLDKIYS